MPHERTILLVLAGSRAHGLSRASSDVDLKGVALPTRRQLLGFRETFEQADHDGVMDAFVDRLTDEERRAAERHGVEGTLYSLRKFAKLAAASNPNILEVLFARDADVRVCTPLGERLREARGDFLSAQARHTFAGYASSQLKRIETHRRWLLHPPAGPPTRAGFGLPDKPLLPKDQLQAGFAAVDKAIDGWSIDFGELAPGEVIRLQGELARYARHHNADVHAVWSHAARTIGMDESLIAVLDRERRYRAAKREWRHYAGWQASRNPARAALEAAHGYDTKHGAHLIRLLRMGFEILDTAEVHVWRGDRDADELRSIRDGAWSYDRLLEEAEAIQTRIARRARQPLSVPAAPDIEAIDALVMRLHAEVT